LQQKRDAEERVKIVGMYCASCALAVEKALSSLRGVASASVSFAAGDASISYDPDKVSLREVVRAVRKLGYDVYTEELVLKFERPLSPDEANALEKKLCKARGVVEVHASPVSQFARVVVNPLSVRAEEVLELAAQLGLRAEVERAEALEEVSSRKALEKELRATKRLAAACLLLSAALVAVRLAPTWPSGARELAELALSLPVVAVGGGRFFANAIKAARAGHVGMDALVALGAGSTFAFSVAALAGLIAGGTYFEASALTVSFVLLGKYVELKMRAKAGEVVEKLASLLPKSATVLRGGAEVEVPVAELRAGDIVVVKTGEKVPVDGVVEEGRAWVDESAFTGEPIPALKEPGSVVLAGSAVASGFLRVRATRVGRETVLSQMARLVRVAQSMKPPVRRLVDAFSRWFAVIAIATAAVAAAYWALVEGAPADRALLFAASVLLVSCPCAIGLATPLAIAVAVGRLAEEGVVVKSPEVFEKAHKATAVAFDKTGTLTLGRPRVAEVVALGAYSEREVLLLAASAERKSEHPLAKALVEHVRVSLGAEPEEPGRFDELPGLGVIAVVGGREVVVGNEKLLESCGVDCSRARGAAERLREGGRTVVFVAVSGELAGLVAFSDEPKREAKAVVSKLKEMGLRVLVLSGDSRRSAEALAKELGADEVRAELSPEEKAEAVRELQEGGQVVVVVGDGVNDAAALSQADVGVAVGRGADVAREAGDAVLVEGSLWGVVALLEASKAARRKVLENLSWAFGYNAALVPVAAGALYKPLGIALSPELAALAMALSSVTVVANSLRLGKRRLLSRRSSG